MTKKIAVVQYDERTGYEWDEEPVIYSITDWEEVDDATYEKLLHASRDHAFHRETGIPRFTVLVQPSPLPVFIKTTVKGYAEYVDRIREEWQQKQREAEELRKRKREEKAAQALERKRKQLEKLKKELGDQ